VARQEGIHKKEKEKRRAGAGDGQGERGVTGRQTIWREARRQENEGAVPRKCRKPVISKQLTDKNQI